MPLNGGAPHLWHRSHERDAGNFALNAYFASMRGKGALQLRGALRLNLETSGVCSVARDCKSDMRRPHVPSMCHIVGILVEPEILL